VRYVEPILTLQMVLENSLC